LITFQLELLGLLKRHGDDGDVVNAISPQAHVAQQIVKQARTLGVLPRALVTIMETDTLDGCGVGLRIPHIGFGFACLALQAPVLLRGVAPRICADLQASAWAKPC
jgi:hypothetical protein